MPRKTSVVDIADKWETEVRHHDADLMESPSFKTNEEVRMAWSVFSERNRENLERCGITT
jgi:hypothetical protein